jgi:hypothetical protein
MTHILKTTTLRCDSVSRYLLLELIEEENEKFYIVVNQGETYKLKSKDEYFIRLRRANLSSRIQTASEFSEQKLLQITSESNVYIENFRKRNCKKTKEIKVALIKEEISNLREYSLQYFDEYIAIMYELVMIKNKESKIFFTPVGPGEYRILVGEDIENSRSLIDELITMYRKELI